MLTGLTALRSLGLGNCRKITDKGFRALIIPLSRQSLAEVYMDHRYDSTRFSSVSPRQTQVMPHAFQPSSNI